MPDNTVEIKLHAKDDASAAIGNVVGQLRGMMVQLAAMAGLASAGAGLAMLAKRGIEFNKSMEDTKGGIAGVLLMTREYVDAAGNVVTGQKAMNSAFTEASQIQEKLKKDALNTAASYTELVQAFQSAAGPAAAAGIENLDDLREITVMATQAMAALNIPTAQAAQELRGLFTGDMGPDNRLNQILRVTKEDLAKVHGNADAVAKLFKDRLAAAASVAGMQTGTLTVRLSNLGDVLDQSLGAATQGIFKDLSDLIAEVSSGIGENAGLFADLAETIREAFGIIGDVVKDVFGMINSTASETGLSWREMFIGVATVFLGLIETIGSGVKAITQYLTSPLDTIMGLWKTLVLGIASLLSELFLKLSETPVIGQFFKGWSMGMDDLVVSMTTAGDRFARFEKTAEENFGDGALARTRKFLDGYATAAKTTGDEADKLGSRVKKAAEEAGAAAYHFGIVWANGSAEATKAMAKLNKEFDEFTGTGKNPAITKIEEDFEGLTGQIGVAMMQGWVAFDDGLAMLETLAEAKGQKITEAIFNGEAVVEESIGYFALARQQLQKGAEQILGAFSDAGKGVEAGWMLVMAGIPNAAESAARAVQEVWGSMGRAFDGILVAGLKGDLDGLKGAFQSFADSLLGTFASLITDMLQRWIAGSETIAKGWENLNKSMQNSSGGLSLQGGMMAAGTGYGIGSMVGQGTQANQIGAAAGAVIGAIVLSAIPVVGTILGAIVGGLIGELFNKNTEKHLKGSLGGMVGATSWTQKPIYGPRGPIKPGDRDEFGDPEPIGWEWVGTVQKATTAFERTGQKIFESQAASFADIFRTGAKDDARALLTAYQTALKDAMSGANFDIAAGSDEDIQKNSEYLLGVLLPRIGLSAAFGQKGYLPTGNRDGAGGIPGINYGMPGMDDSGQWIEKQLFDKDAAIPKLLAGLGVTEAKIGELASRISTDDPEKLLAYIEGLVGVLVEFKRLGTEMGKSVAEIWKGFDDTAKESATTGIGKAATDVAALFEALTLYSGDEQLAKAKEAQDASAALWEGVLDYLAQLKQLADDMSASILAKRVEMREFLNPKTDTQKVSGGWATVEGGWGKLFASKTADEALAAANGMRDAIDEIFGIMAERITAGNALLGRLSSLGDAFGSIGQTAKDSAFAEANPIAAFAKDAAALSQKVSDAAKLSGMEQINAIAEVAASAEDMYARQLAMIRTIAANISSLEKSIESQKWELGLDGKEGADAATYITDRVNSLQEAIKKASSPEEVQRLTNEIQALLGRYLGTFAEDDPNRDKAKDWISEMLDRTLGLAKESYGKMSQALEEANDKIRQALEAAGTLIGDNVTEASDWVKQLSQTLGELDGVFRGLMETLGTAALDAMEPLRTAMETAAGLFTGATGTASNALAGPEASLTTAAGTAVGALGAFEAAVRSAAERLGALGGGGSSSTAPPTADVNASGSGSRVTAAEVVPLVRRFYGQLAPRVG